MTYTMSEKAIEGRRKGGKANKGKPKNFSDEEKQKRAERLRQNGLAVKKPPRTMARIDKDLCDKARENFNTIDNALRYALKKLEIDY